MNEPQAIRKNPQSEDFVRNRLPALKPDLMLRRSYPMLPFVSTCDMRLLAPITALFLLFFAAFPPPAAAQENYEIQVYPYDTVEPGHTMLELHSNFAFQGSKTSEAGMLPTNHQLHETIEITHGFTDWFETGFYIFTSAKSGQGLQWVGDNIRPRVRIPPQWKLPAGSSLPDEIG